jgi:hypothetical protein
VQTGALLGSEIARERTLSLAGASRTDDGGATPHRRPLLTEQRRRAREPQGGRYSSSLKPSWEAT